MLGGLKLIQKGVLSSDSMKVDVVEPEPRRLLPYSVSGPLAVWTVTEIPLAMGIADAIGGV